MSIIILGFNVSIILRSRVYIYITFYKTIYLKVTKSSNALNYTRQNWCILRSISDSVNLSIAIRKINKALYSVLNLAIKPKC